METPIFGRIVLLHGTDGSRMISLLRGFTAELVTVIFGDEYRFDPASPPGCVVIDATGVGFSDIARYVVMAKSLGLNVPVLLFHDRKLIHPARTELLSNGAELYLFDEETWDYLLVERLDQVSGRELVSTVG